MTLSDSAVPIEERYFEDYVPGAVFEYGEIRVDEAEIIYLPGASTRRTCMLIPRRRPAAVLAG